MLVMGAPSRKRKCEKNETLIDKDKLDTPCAKVFKSLNAVIINCNAFIQQLLEEERKWLRYKIDSVTKEQAVIFCILGQLLLPPEDIKGSRNEIPLPDDAKQILLFMTYGDHWLLRDLSYVLGYVDKVNSFIMSFEGLGDLRGSSRSYLEALIINQFGIPKNDICYESDD